MEPKGDDKKLIIISDTIILSFGMGLFSVGYVLGRHITVLKNRLAREKAYEEIIEYYNRSGVLK